MKKNNHLYIGKAGHLVAMSEFLMRGWNVAIPEVDIGDDIFVVQDENAILKKVQVKTATAKIKKNGRFSCQFKLPLNQLNRTFVEPIYYIFIVRHKELWAKPIVIRQDQLKYYWEEKNIGTQYKNALVIYFAYSSDEKVEYSKIDFSKYINDYSDFPIL